MSQWLESFSVLDSLPGNTSVSWVEIVSGSPSVRLVETVSDNANVSSVETALSKIMNQGLNCLKSK